MGVQPRFELSEREIPIYLQVAAALSHLFFANRESQHGISLNALFIIIIRFDRIEVQRERESERDSDRKKEQNEAEYNQKI